MKELLREIQQSPYAWPATPATLIAALLELDARLGALEEIMGGMRDALNGTELEEMPEDEEGTE